MKQRILKINVYKLLRQRNALIILAVGMCLSNMLLAAAVFLANERVVLVPPHITKSFWCDSKAVSREYLEEMSLFFARQLLDVSPASAEYQRRIVLGYVSPEYHNQLKKRLIIEGERYQKQNVSTSFKPIKVKVSPEKLVAEVVGDLISFVGQARVKESRESYRLNYRYRDGRLLITNFELLETRDAR